MIEDKETNQDQILKLDIQLRKDQVNRNRTQFEFDRVEHARRNVEVLSKLMLNSMDTGMEEPLRISILANMGVLNQLPDISYRSKA